MPNNFRNTILHYRRKVQARRNYLVRQRDIYVHIYCSIILSAMLPMITSENAVTELVEENVNEFQYDWSTDSNMGWAGERALYRFFVHVASWPRRFFHSFQKRRKTREEARAKLLPPRQEHEPEVVDDLEQQLRRLRLELKAKKFEENPEDKRVQQPPQYRSEQQYRRGPQQQPSKPRAPQPPKQQQQFQPQSKPLEQQRRQQQSQLQRISQEQQRLQQQFQLQSKPQVQQQQQLLLKQQEQQISQDQKAPQRPKKLDFLKKRERRVVQDERKNPNEQQMKLLKLLQGKKQHKEQPRPGTSCGGSSSGPVDFKVLYVKKPEN